MPLPNRLIGWISNANSAAAPPGTLQTAGHAGGDAFPMMEWNWLLRKLTYWIDGILDDGSGNPSGALALNALAGTYTQTRLFSNWRMVYTWSRGGVNLAQPTYTQPNWDSDPGTELVPLPGYPRQCLAQGVGANPGFPFIAQSVELPFGAQQITSVAVRVKPTAAGRAALPTTMPKLTWWIVDQDGTVAFTGGQTDASANVAAYETAHSISANVNQAIAPATQQFIVAIEGEDDGVGGGGSNFKPGLEVKAALVTYQFNLMNEVVFGSPL